jgi:hypothetical protein
MLSPNIVTFKDLRRIIAEKQKLDDKLARLGLRPEESGNGHGREWEWKGRPTISNEEWKRLAGYTDFSDIITPEEEEYLEVNHNLPKETWDRATSEIRREISPEALQYFPQDIITVVFNPSYSCPKAPDLFKVWVSDYRELLTSKGFRKAEYDGSF